MDNRNGEGCSRKNPSAARERDVVANQSSPVIAAFKGKRALRIQPTALFGPLFVETFLSVFEVFQQELDTKHDKYERLVKLSRDITIESKRTIFLLHRVTNVPDTESVLNEAEVKLDGVRQRISQVAEELRGEDIFQFHRAFTPGNTGPYEVSKKLHTLRQSLGKVEDACYTLRVRGSEIPKHMLADVFSCRTTLMDPEEGAV
ncbi:unnamed protein product [Menidia menidia]|uniref:(Atlantic silverside) hypothetical protein n=1 Tax=Menidia menidia TaxID=238744 RepID=A0A8S4BW35_9TELE|nr:unnamed protein product [Menidia menidia]